MLKQDVLRGDKAFDSVYKKGRSKGDKYVVLFYLKNDLDYNRTAFVASKKVGNSVKRHRATRLMRESFRNIGETKEGYDLIFIARNSINGRKCQDVLSSMKSVLGKAGLFR